MGQAARKSHHRRCNQLTERPDAPAERLEQIPRAVRKRPRRCNSETSISAMLCSKSRGPHCEWPSMKPPWLPVVVTGLDPPVRARLPLV